MTKKLKFVEEIDRQIEETQGIGNSCQKIVYEILR